MGHELPGVWCRDYSISLRVSDPAEPIRDSVVLCRQTDALLAPPSSAAVIRSRVSVLIIGGQPPWRPRRFAAASPAITRSRFSARGADAPRYNGRTSQELVDDTLRIRPGVPTDIIALEGANERLSHAIPLWTTDWGRARD